MKFKIGDKVTNRIGEIIEIDTNDTDIPYHIKFNNDTMGWCSENGLILIPELKTEKITNKNELKNGDVVTLRNGDKLLYRNKEFIDLSDENDNQLAELNDLNKNMDYIDNSNYDIIKVERPREYQTVFEREEIKEMTLKEIEKELGCKVKIIEEEN